ncbi:SDR family oxidoreductase [Pseudenhygromyxa sp. WMMC2535]|uniref:SDR family NAD(P)-dependent oxidoreductase n=1 Tax=Pseudenhygromyxa sp. WMMC2535 TaxID=2712867 RepID=UPI00155743FF|nr:SDR family oxidoreductase [Pseudenhygromyxa sp. WMMC2535]NVB38953.1 SDR family oxidoreductase [Pseudenhygromyxa sp. WMMC2535]
MTEARSMLITGASRGIGRAAAARFVAAGWQVFALSRSRCPVEGVTWLEADLLDPQVDERVAAWLDAELGAAPGKLCLIHNAATLTPDTAVSIDPASLRETLELNVVAPARLNRLLVPRMAAGSSVLYVGSTLSEKAVAGVASYVLSKHALAGLMKSTCQDLAGTGVHTACVCPGFTRTEMLVDRAGGDAEVLASLAGLSTFARLVEPEEIAAVLHFAADNPVINGAMLHANLGQVER